ncbi:hypothetical protein CRG98_019810 [Punica granatum]|uniref:Uncharacterized protein n=1 Tax=Punica granatum TaxID=22663 RepID=A0A2I0JU23_PUNGR|nr:hypothetical protein CRG98_019810 [Punica granatum]
MGRKGKSRGRSWRQSREVQQTKSKGKGAHKGRRRPLWTPATSVEVSGLSIGSPDPESTGDLRLYKIILVWLAVTVQKARVWQDVICYTFFGRYHCPVSGYPLASVVAQAHVLMISYILFLLHHIPTS